MKHLLLTAIAAVVLVGCATTQSPEPLISKAPDISIHEAVASGNIEPIKQHLADGADVNATDEVGWTPLFESLHPLKYS
jgi:ankyrin repeat protein